MNETEDGYSGGAEESAEGEVNAGCHTVKHVGLHILHRIIPNRLITGKQRENRFGDELKNDSEESPKGSRDNNAARKCLFRTFLIPGAKALSGNRRYG